VAVDLAQKGHARARRNLELSGLDPESVEAITGDVFAVLARMAERGRRFDLVVVDPPSFSQTKTRVFTALKDWSDLTAQVLSVLAPGGSLFVCSNTAKLGADELERSVGEGAFRAGARLAVIARHGLPADYPTSAGFPEGAYLKCVELYRQGQG
jgi:23S rRNA (cytosine1962-C5)-methyltransferase